MYFKRVDFAADFAPGDYHIDGFISDLLIGYRPQGFIAGQIFPVIPVNKQTGVFAKIDKGNWFRVPTTHRSIATAPREVRYTVSSDTYAAKNYALATVVPFETMDNADAPHVPMQRAGEFLVDQLDLDFEVRVYNTIVGGVGSSMTLTGGNAWNDLINSAPLDNLETGRESIRQSTGFKPNTMVIGERAWLKMRRHPDVVRAIYPGAGVGGLVQPQQFADLIGISRVFVAGTIKNTGAEGLGDTFGDVWSTHCIMMYVDPNPSIMTPTFGAAFRWSGPNIGAGGPQGAYQIERARDPERKVEKVRTDYYQDEKIVAAELGYMIQTGIQ